MSWAYIDETGDIKEYGSLPKSWQNISNFFALESDKERLASLGWYRLVDMTVPVTNDFTEYHGEAEYSFSDESKTVTKIKPLLKKCPPSIQDQLPVYSRDEFFATLKAERNKRLADSDWTQSADLQAIKDEQWKSEWVEYRQKLRDLPEIYEQEQYSHVLDISEVDWPIIPSFD